MTQDEALDILKLGRNVFLTGPPGSGKTFLLNKYIDYLKTNHKAVGVTASTGIAATHMAGITIHSWSGLGIQEVLGQNDIDTLLKKPYLKKRFRETGVLVIDEISMINAVQFDTINRICQAFKSNLAPFGGMQVVCSGDFFQLPPIEKQRKIRFAFASNVWQAMDMQVCYLEEQHRHKDDELFQLLNYIRNNAIEQARQVLTNKEFNKQFPGVIPTKLYTHNVDVDTMNSIELAKIGERELTYNMEHNGRKKVVAGLIKSCLAPERLVIKKGAQVMFVKNNFDKGYVNGTRGKIIGFDEDRLPIVETFSGDQIIVTPANWVIKEDDEVIAEIRQMPLRLAWAITVHKSQGMNLDTAEIDLSKSFVEGMGYVALSRLTSLDGLKLIGINELALCVNQEVLELDREFLQMSEQVSKSLAEIPILQKTKDQISFLDSLSGFMQGMGKSSFASGELRRGKKKKKKKIGSTYEVTRVLVMEKMSLSDIAKCRDLKEDTILTHLEKLVKIDPELDLIYLQPPRHRFEKIKEAFEQADSLRLTQARETLGDSFSYQELRLVGLFMDDKEGSIKEKIAVLRPKDYNCVICDRPITRKGNCMPCNIEAKRKREDEVQEV